MCIQFSGDVTEFSKLPLRSGSCEEALKHCPSDDKNDFELINNDENDQTLDDDQNGNSDVLDQRIIATDKCKYNMEICKNSQDLLLKLKTEGGKFRRSVEDNKYGFTMQQFEQLKTAIPAKNVILSDIEKGRLNDTVKRMDIANKAFRDLNIQMNKVSYTQIID